MELQDQLLELFVTQSRDLLVLMEESLLGLERRPGDREALNAVFRVCHTLKGDARALDLADIGELAHVLEDLLESMRDEQVEVTSDAISLLLSTVDMLREMVAQAAGGASGTNRHVPLLEGLRRMLEAEDPNAELRRLAATRSAWGDPHGPAASVAGPATLRVRLATLDRLLDMVGELATARERLTQGFSVEEERVPVALAEAHRGMDKVFAALQNEVLRLRLVAIGPLFRDQLRTIRDASLVEGKRVRLRIEGEDAELDTAVVTQLREPLGHLVRNAVAHGIEPPDERTAAGKDPVGEIVLSARREGASVVIEVTDDGAGLHREQIRARALQLGLVADADGLADEDLDELVFAPGFSTSQAPTATAGRGVGLDVVRSQVEALGGATNVDSEPGQGARWRLRLPLTLAIIDGFAMRVGSEVYLLPLDAVAECVDYISASRRDAGSAGLVHLRGSAVPYLRLRELLKAPGAASGRESIVVVERSGRRVGLVVDELLGGRQAVIKPLSRCLREVAEIVGSTVLGDGRVALVLDAEALLDRAEDAHRAGRTNGRARPPALLSSPKPERAARE